MLDDVKLLRLTIFFSLLIFFILLEFIWPRRGRRLPRFGRWTVNTLLTMLGAFLASLIPAFLFEPVQYQFGLLNQLETPFVAQVIISVLVLDMTIYWQHRIFHKVPLLWKLHKVHHTDLDLDVTSGFRFHPLEIFLSLLVKITVIWILGAPLLGVLIFEICLSSGALFNHSNIAIKGKLDACLQKVLVTPDMHRIHHSIVPKEMHSNFGFSVSLWDHFFGSYLAKANQDQTSIILGIEEEQQANLSFYQVLLLPFMKHK